MGTKSVFEDGLSSFPLYENRDWGHESAFQAIQWLGARWLPFQLGPYLRVECFI